MSRAAGRTAPAARCPGPQGGLHLPRDVLEHLVARGMAIAVVHILEAVQVEQQHRNVLAAALGLLHRQLQLVPEPGAVGQARERVVVRQVFQLPLLGLFFGDVGEHAHVMRDLARRVAHGRQRHVLRKDFAVLAAVPDLALPVPGLGQGRPHRLIKRLVVAARLEDARGLAQQLFFGIAQQPGERCVDRQDAAVGIGHHHALHGVVHHRGGQALAGLAALQRGARGLDLVEVLHHTHQVRGLIAHFGRQRHGAQHGHPAAVVQPQAVALAHVVVDLAGQQALQLRRGPVRVLGDHHITEIEAQRLHRLSAQQVIQAGVGP